MAGRGPAPKETKRRRNRKDADELPAEGHSGAGAPKLPKTYRVEGEKRPVSYLRSTRTWYTTWTRSPMATRFTAVDWQRLIRLAAIVDQYDRGDLSRLAEIRLQEAKFGGTPLDRLSLGLQIKPPETPTTPERKATARPSARRARLSVVK